VRQAAYRAHRANPRVLIMTFDNGVYEKLPLEQHVANYATSKFCLAPAGYGFSSRQYECVLVGCVPVVIQVRGVGRVRKRVWQPRWLSVLSCGPVCRSCVTVISRLAPTHTALVSQLLVGLCFAFP